MRSHCEGPTIIISSREIIGVYFFRRGPIPFKVNLEGTQRLNRGLLTPAHGTVVHHVMVEPIRVLQEKKLASSNKAVSSPYLSLQLANGEEGIGDLVTLLRLDRIVLRERRGVSRHLERSELTFNI
jgi:hypothetical protein